MTASLEEQQAPSRTRWETPRDWITSLAAAFQFLTMMPPLVRRPFTPQELGRSVGWFPLVGAAIGGLLIGLDRLLGLLFPAGVTAALLLAAWVLATGALHLDGFLDSCDGLFGGRTPEARLRIMRDERAGAFAVIGGILLLLVKYAALAANPNRLAALMVAPVIGRWAMTLAIVGFPYGRTEGLGRDIKDHAHWPQVVRASLIAVAAVAPLAWLDWRALTLLPLAAMVTWIGARLVLRRLPGLTGDIYGALCVLVEAVVLLAFVAGGNHAA